MKSKLVAYLLLFTLGFLGAHRFYLGKVGTGILYLCTGGLLGIGLLIDLFTLSGQVDTYNAFHGLKLATHTMNNNQAQSVVVNVSAPAMPQQPATPAPSDNVPKEDTEKI